MYLYILLNVLMGLIGVIALLYLAFRFFAWKQGDAKFIIEARRRNPFELKEMTSDTAVFETEVPFHIAARTVRPLSCQRSAGQQGSGT